MKPREEKEKIKAKESKLIARKKDNISTKRRKRKKGRSSK